jgi:RNA polymerase sigma-70 factor (ECF subfamily)
LKNADAKIVQRCVQGDTGAWEGLVRMYSGRLMNLAYRYTANYSVSEELTQDIFIKVYQNLDSFRADSGSLQNWILRVGRNLIIDHYRSHKREKHVAGSEELEALDFSESTSSRNPFETVHLKEKAEFLNKGLQKISPELKEAVLLRDIEGFAYQEIADMLQIPEGTVKSRINRGRIELAKTLRKMKEGK